MTIFKKRGKLAVWEALSAQPSLTILEIQTIVGYQSMYSVHTILGKYPELFEKIDRSSSDSAKVASWKIREGACPPLFESPFDLKKYMKEYGKSEAKKAYNLEYKRTPEYRSRNAASKRAEPREYIMWVSARERARKQGCECTLDVSDIVIPEYCPLLGIPIIRGDGKASPNSPSLDRKDPTKGYTKDNVWVISWRANRIKSDATADELRLLVQRLTENGL